jgi:hypothetical protein
LYKNFIAAAFIAVALCGCSVNKQTPAGTAAMSEQAKAEAPVKTDVPVIKEPDVLGYTTPEIAFEGFKAAFIAKDWKKVFDSMDAESQDTLTGSMVYTVQAVAGKENRDSEDKEKPFSAIMAKYNIETVEYKTGADPKDTMATMKELGRKIKNRQAFIHDAQAEARKKFHIPERKAEEMNVILKDIKIDGDKATAKAVVKQGGKDVEKPFSFTKGKNGWLVHLNSDFFQ